MLDSTRRRRSHVPDSDVVAATSVFTRQSTVDPGPCVGSVQFGSVIGLLVESVGTVCGCTAVAATRRASLPTFDTRAYALFRFRLLATRLLLFFNNFPFYFSRRFPTRRFRLRGVD